MFLELLQQILYSVLRGCSAKALFAVVAMMLCLGNELSASAETVTGQVRIQQEIPELTLVTQISFRGATKVIVIDIDGDGRDELLPVDARATACSILRMEGYAKLTDIALTPCVKLLPDKVQVGDIDGDSKQELVSFGNATIQIVRIEPQGTTTVQNMELPLPIDDLFVTDVQGDALPDIVTYSKSDGMLRVMRSPWHEGTKFEIWGNFSTHVTWPFFVTGDFNSDGKQDIAGYTSPDSDWWYQLSEANSFNAVKGQPFDPTVKWTNAISLRINEESRDIVAMTTHLGENSPWFTAGLLLNGTQNEFMVTKYDGTEPIPVQGAFVAPDEGAVLIFRRIRDKNALEVRSLRSFKNKQFESEVPFLDYITAGPYAADMYNDGMDEIVFVTANSIAVFRLQYYQGLAGVRVGVPKSTTVTDNEGQFSLEVSPGTGVQISVERQGYLIKPEKGDHALGANGQYNFIAQQVPGGTGPFACIGSYPGRSKWGRTNGSCPTGYAMMEVDDFGTKADLLAICCRLPADDILTNESTLVERDCPSNFIVTGRVAECLNCAPKLQCTKLDTGKYVLSKAKAGTFWGLGYSSREKSALLKHRIPVSFRFAVGRSSRKSWDLDGCIGSPIGSVLVSKSGSDCRNMLFSEIAHVSDAGIKPLIQFPECKRITDPLDRHAVCIPASDSTP